MLIKLIRWVSNGTDLGLGLSRASLAASWERRQLVRRFLLPGFFLSPLVSMKADLSRLYRQYTSQLI
jgi:hypothetical protein